MTHDGSHSAAVGTAATANSSSSLLDTAGGPPYASVQLPAAGDGGQDLAYELVLSYLALNCYGDTVRALIGNVSSSSNGTANGAANGHGAAPSTPRPVTTGNNATPRRPTTRSSASKVQPSSGTGADALAIATPSRQTHGARTSADDAMDLDGDTEMSGGTMARAAGNAVAAAAAAASSQTKSGAAATSTSTASWKPLVETLEHRKVLRELLVSGKVQEAVAHCQRQFPGLVLDLQAVDTALAQPSPRSANSTSSSSAASLVANTAAASSPTTPSTSTLTAAQLDPLTVTFHLQCQHYIELVRANRQADALNFAQEVLSKFAAARPSFGDVLRDVVALIAYADPSASPVGHFLKQERREEVAEVLNGAILARCGLRSKSTLETLVRQVTVVREAYTAAEATAAASAAAVKDKKTTTAATVPRNARRWRLADFLQAAQE